MTVCLSIPMPPMGKERPRVTRKGTYMPDRYVAWKNEFVIRAKSQTAGQSYFDTIAGPVRISTIFYTRTGNCRSDCDNAHAACLDALQDARIIANDRQVKAGAYAITQGMPERIEVTIEEIP